MFKRLKDRVSSAMNSSSSTSAIDTLKSMGFSERDCRQALQNCDNNIERAGEWLLAYKTPTSAAATAAITQQTEDDDLQRAMLASLEVSSPPAASAAVPVPPALHTRSAASKRAGQAALARFESKEYKNNRKKKLTVTNSVKKTATTTTTAAANNAIVHNSSSNNNSSNNSKKDRPVASHPNVQIPKRLSQHDKEDQILRCANRVAPHPLAVDTLLKSLTQLQKNPNNPKFKTIDTSSAGFQKSLANTPGVMDYFKAMNYQPQPFSPKVLELTMVDPATLYLGISALEQVKLTSMEYRNNKALMQFDKDILQILQLGDVDTQEAIRRSNHLSKCPSEPTNGSWIQVELGSQEKIKRKFDGDDTLEDVLNWLGSHGSQIPSKLLVSTTKKEQQQIEENDIWFLVDRNLPSNPPYNVLELQHKTLQYIGCWPSGRLAIVPFLTKEQENMNSSSRGLGAAPMDHLRL